MIHKKMELQPQPSNWSCLPTAFAMCAGLSVEEVIAAIGHDGSAKGWINASEHGEIGFHLQEIYDLALSNDIAITPIDVNPTSKHWHHLCNDEKVLWPLEKCEDRFKKYLEQNYGIILGRIGFNACHSVAWDGEKVYDPRDGGMVYGINDGQIAVETFMIFRSLHIVV